MRTLHELYKLLLKVMKEQGQKVEPQQQLVWMVATRKITTEEFQAIMVDYKKNKPTKKLHSKFYNHELFSKNLKKQDWWSYPCKETRQQMRLFVAKMVRINK